MSRTMKIITGVLAALTIFAICATVFAQVADTTAVPGQPVTVPTDFIVIGGVLLSTVLGLVVAALKYLKIIKDGTPVKKSIGVYLALFGAVVGGYSGYRADASLYNVVVMIAGGALAGLSAVGFNSAQKNFRERKSK